MELNETKYVEKSEGKENNIHRSELDKNRLSDLFYHMNITRKNFLIYPPHHIQTKQSLKKCHALLHDLLESVPIITIGVAKNKLFVGNVLLEDKGDINKELALSAKNHEIAGVTFCKGVSIDDLSCYFQLMAKDPEKVKRHGGFGKGLSGKGIETVKVQFIDYSKFHHTEEMEIDKTTNRKSQEKSSAIWTEFISGLLSGSLTSSSHGIPMEQLRAIPPSQLALYLNENKIDPSVVLESYRNNIGKHIQKAGETVMVSPTNEDDFHELDLLLQELNPKLKKQFLLATYHEVNSAGKNGAVKNVLNGFSEQFVTDMLRQANESGEEISPSLLNFVYRITSAQDGASGPDKEENTEGSAESLNPFSDRVALQNLFASEKFEEYVTADYENTLKDLTAEIDDKIIDANKVLPLEDFHKELESSHLDSQIVFVILALMRDNITPDEYEIYATKLADIAHDLLTTGEFSTILKIFKALFKHYKEDADPEIRRLAKSTLKKFHEARFVSRAIVSFEKWAKPDDIAVYEFLKSFGVIIIPEMVGLYGKEERPEIQGLIFKVLSRSPEATCLEAKRRLRDPRPSFVINMLNLVRELGAEKDATILKRLLKHHDAGIRITALETLIELKDPEGPDVVRNFIRSVDFKEKLQAIRLIGNYKMADIVPDLISGISRWNLLKSQYEKNEAIITALGKIGHPSAVPVLEQLAKRKWAVRTKSSKNMKIVLYQSLHGYELSQITALLEFGLMSEDIRIRQICQDVGGKNQQVQ